MPIGRANFDGPLSLGYRKSSLEDERVRIPQRQATDEIQLASCPSLSRTAFDGSQDWVIAHNDVVAGSSPASGTKCRSSSVVEHVIPSSFLIRRYALRFTKCSGAQNAVFSRLRPPPIEDCVSAFGGPKIMDYRTL